MYDLETLPTTTHEKLTRAQELCILETIKDVITSILTNLTSGHIPAERELRAMVLDRLAKDHSERLIEWLERNELPPIDREPIPIMYLSRPKTKADYRDQAMAQLMLRDQVVQ